MCLRVEGIGPTRVVKHSVHNYLTMLDTHYSSYLHMIPSYAILDHLMLLVPDECAFLSRFVVNIISPYNKYTNCLCGVKYVYYIYH